MNIIIVKTKEELAEKAYEKMLSAINSKEEVNLGLATGGSPEEIYKLFRERKPQANHVTSINLDEYVGLAPTHEQSYAHYMNEHLFHAVKFKQTFVPKGNAENLQKACEDYEKIIAENPIDLQLLGIGVNGHIAFNEPGSSFTETTHVVELTQSTIDANSRYFARKEDVPTTAISMGIASIMKAKEILLIAYGKEKATAIKQMIEGEISEDCPATVLQKHPNVTVIIDETAASNLA